MTHLTLLNKISMQFWKRMTWNLQLFVFQTAINVMWLKTLYLQEN